MTTSTERVAIVTGASRGIGRAIAMRLAASGLRVVCVARGANADETASLIQAAGHQAEAHGVDVASANIDRAREGSPRCLLYDGRRLPYRDDTFDVVGALNVLEHVEDPEAFVAEAVRVCVPGGRVVLSSPNFLRFLGWRDYHPRMRGVGNKWRNLRALLARRSRMRRDPGQVRFERMQPIIKTPFTPDDDAIVCTNALDIEFFLRRNGCVIEVSACTDRTVAPWLDALLNATPLRYGLFNAFVVARKEPRQAAGT